VARANLFRRTGNWEQVLADFEAVRGRAETDVLFSNYCAMLFYGQREYDEALDIFDSFERTETETGTYAYRLFVQLDEAPKEKLVQECRDMFKKRSRDQKTVQRYNDWTICRLLGESELAEDAVDGFIEGAEALKKEVWLNHGRFMRGEIGAEQLVAACKGRRFEVAHAHFLVAMDYLSQGDRSRAKKSFQSVLDANCCRLFVSWWSEIFLERLEDPNWLPWLPEPEENAQPRR
jgi:hypothetical protein